MEPRIQYAKTEDGVSIAYATIGQALSVAATEPADTLRVATGARMWQFRLLGGSAFRLKNALDRWCHTKRAAARREWSGARNLLAST